MLSGLAALFGGDVLTQWPLWTGGLFSAFLLTFLCFFVIYDFFGGSVRGRCLIWLPALVVFLAGFFLTGGGFWFLPDQRALLWQAGPGSSGGAFPEEFLLLLCSIDSGEAGIEISGQLFPGTLREEQVRLSGPRESRLRVRARVRQAIPPVWWVPALPVPGTARVVLEERGGGEAFALAEGPSPAHPLLEYLTERGLFQEKALEVVLPRREDWYLQPGRYALVLERAGGNVQGGSLRYTRQ